MALPPNWAKFTTEDGKDYYHNAVTSSTQWDIPQWNGSLPESLSFHSGASEVYQYRPTVSDLELHSRVSAPDSAGGVGMAIASSVEAAEAGMKAPSGRVPTSDDRVSLNPGAPAGQMNSGPAPGGAYTGFGNGFVGSAFAALGEDGDGGMSTMAGSALAYVQELFDVSSDDVIKRLRLAALPFPPKANGDVNEFRTRPDFWGPFWVATTGVLFFAATGNFARWLQTDSSTVDFKPNYGLVSAAAMVLYGCLVAVPAITRVAIYFTGQDSSSVNFRQMICVYGYSLTPIIPVSVVCCIPLEFLRWLAVLGGFAASLAFMQGNLLADLTIEAPNLKCKLATLIGAAQGSIFLFYRTHFFS